MRLIVNGSAINGGRGNEIEKLPHSTPFALMDSYPQNSMEDVRNNPKYREMLVLQTRGDLTAAAIRSGTAKRRAIR